MRVAVVGSRSIHTLDLSNYLPPETTELISGGAVGTDRCTEEYAKRKGIPITVFLPDYDHFGRAAPLVRNRTIVESCDLVLAFWDGLSRGTLHTVRYARKIGKEVKLYRKQ